MKRRVSMVSSANSTKSFGLTKINQYVLIKQIGVGAYGQVYLGVSTETNPVTKSAEEKSFAIKIIKKSKLKRR